MTKKTFHRVHGSQAISVQLAHISWYVTHTTSFFYVFVFVLLLDFLFLFSLAVLVLVCWCTYRKNHLIQNHISLHRLIQIHYFHYFVSLLMLQHGYTHHHLQKCRLEYKDILFLAFHLNLLDFFIGVQLLVQQYSWFLRYLMVSYFLVLLRSSSCLHLLVDLPCMAHMLALFFPAKDFFIACSFPLSLFRFFLLFQTWKILICLQVFSMSVKCLVLCMHVGGIWQSHITKK